MITSSVSGDINKGDFIIIAQGAYLELGFYLGKGQGTSRQYYNMSTLIRWLENPESYSTKKGVPPVQHKSFYKYTVAKYSPELLVSTELEDYKKSIEALRILKIIN